MKFLIVDDHLNKAEFIETYSRATKLQGTIDQDGAIFHKGNFTGLSNIKYEKTRLPFHFRIVTRYGRILLSGVSDCISSEVVGLFCKDDVAIQFFNRSKNEWIDKCDIFKDYELW